MDGVSSVFCFIWGWEEPAWGLPFQFHGAFYVMISLKGPWYASVIWVQKRSALKPTTALVRSRSLMNNSMICFIASNFNSYSQFDYDADIRSIVLFLVPCPHCSARGAFIFYGHYSRSYFSLTDGSICFLRIQRVRCRHCHHTHALLPHFLVPFRRFQLGHLLSFAYWKKTYPPSLNSLCDRFPWHDKSVIHRLCKHISPWLMKHDISPSYCSLVVFLSLYPCFDSYPFCSAPRKNISFLFLPT